MTDRLIHILPEQVASQIAAGEVVERPASAVKELIENSLDAGARNVAIEIEAGGSRLLAVGDDGCGMGREDAILSLRRHATSKIRSAEDLSAIRTLGFRGEALASIASVSKMLLRSRRADAPAGVEIDASGGDVLAARECAIAPGARIEVRELFYNTPARLKFLKTVATEQGAVAEAVQRLALANHAVGFTLVADGRTMLELPRARSLIERIRQLFGDKLAQRMLPFEGGTPGLRVGGHVTVSQDSFPTPRMVFTFVNHRAVRDRLLARAVAQAYATLIPRGRHPAAVLFLTIRPEDIDVNVHPMKTEVRFRRSGAVFELVYGALRARLADQTAATYPPAPYEAASDTAVAPTAVIESAAGPDAGASPAPAQTSAAPAPLRLVIEEPPRIAEQRPLGLGYQSGGNGSGDSAPVRPSPIPRYSDLRILGQLFAGYIVLEDDDGLLLLDQHAAHERVTFERLGAELRGGGIRVQPHLVPEALELDPARAAQVRAALPELRALGFDLEPFGPTTLVLKGTPAVFGAGAGPALLRDFIGSMGDNGFSLRGEAAFEGMLKQLACHGSIRVGRALELREIHELLADLDRTEFKTNCPHGRPVHVRFARGQIERMFRR